MTSVPFAAYEMFAHPEKLLAVAGGAALGGLGVGFLVQVIVRGWTGQQVPRWVLMTLRAVAAVASGWLVALWLFSGGGGGMGGPGVWGFGTGTGDSKPPETAKDKEPHKDSEPTRNVNTLEIEVLGSETLRQINPNYDPQRCYRIGTRLLTRKEVIEYLKQRQKDESPPEAVTIVLYDNSPAEDVPKVADLKDEVGALTVAGGSKRLSVAVQRRTQNAPVKE
jgi:hypothetical protein